MMKISVFFLLVTITAAAIPHGLTLGDTFDTYYGLKPAAIVIMDSDMDTFNDVRKAAERSDARGLLFYPPEAVFGHFPAGLSSADFGGLPVSIIRSKSEIMPGALGTVIHRVISGLFEEREFLRDVHMPGGLEFDDALLRVPEEVALMTRNERPMTGAPSEVTSRGIKQNSEFTIGSVLVNVIFPESAGISEDWTDEEIGNALRDISIGLSLYLNKAHWVDMSFTINCPGDFRKVPVTVEPIETNFKNGSDIAWIYESLQVLGYDFGPQGVWYAAHRLNNKTRGQFGTDWVFTAFVADQSAHHDPDPPLPDPGCWGGAGYTAYAYLGGPYLVVPYPGCRYGYGESFGQLFDHEMCHIFWALDEYRSAGTPCNERSGYLNVETGNSFAILLGQDEPCGDGLDCIMNNAMLSGCPICWYTMGQLGLADENENSVPDIYEVYPTVEFLDVPGLSDTTYNGSFLVAVRARNGAVPNKNPDQSDSTRINYAPWLVGGSIRINNSLSEDVYPTFGDWDSSEEEVSFILRGGLEPGNNKIYFGVENCVGLKTESVTEVTFIGLKYYTYSAMVESDFIEISWKTAKEVFGAEFDLIREDITAGTLEEIIKMVDGDSASETGTSTSVYKYKDYDIVSGHRYRYRVVGRLEVEFEGEPKEYNYKTRNIYRTAIIPVTSGIISHIIPNPTDHRGTSFTIDVPKSYYDPTGGSRMSGESGIYRAPSVIETKTPVDVAIYNVKGQRVRHLYSMSVFGGIMNKYWDILDDSGQMVSPGVYFIRVKAGNDEAVKKVIILR